MSTETQAASSIEATTDAVSWKGCVLAGIVAALVMGALMWVMNNAVIAVAIPGLYGLAPPPNPIAGWVVHLFHGAVFGMIFGGLLRAEMLAGTAADFTKSVGLGVAYGVVVWVVAAALVMPLWLSAVGFPEPPAFPNFALPSLLWHAVFGLVLGALVPYVADL